MPTTQKCPGKRLMQAHALVPMEPVAPRRIIFAGFISGIFFY
jgi:hypothetical protein